MTPETFGPFRIYAPTAEAPEGWAISYGGAWLPGTYANRDAALFACGYVLGGEGCGYLDDVRSRMMDGALITVEELTSLEPPQ